MAGKTAKLNCTLTSTTTTNTTDTKCEEDRAKRLSYEHWSTEKSVKDRADAVRKSWQFLRLIKKEVNLRSWTLSRTGIASTHCQNKLSCSRA